MPGSEAIAGKAYTMTTRKQHNSPPETLEQLIDTLATVRSDGTDTNIGAILEAVGTRSFGPLLILAGIIVMSPLSGVPGVPTTVGVFVALISLQLLCGRRHFWLPQWIKRRCVPRSRYETALRGVRRPARFVDRFLRPRIVMLTNGLGQLVIAAVCLLIAASMALMEFVPFSASIVGVIFTAFGLSLVAHDGLLGVAALLATVCIVVLVRLLL